MSAPSTSVRTLMATLLDRELRARFNFCVSRDTCEEIISAVISGAAAIAGSVPFLPPAPPPVRPLDGGCISPGVASAVTFSSAEREAMAQRFDRADECRLHCRPKPLRDEMYRDALIAGDDLKRLAAMIRSEPSPSSADLAPPRTPDGGCTPSGAAPAVTSAQGAPCLRCDGLCFVPFARMNEAQRRWAPAEAVLPCPDCTRNAEIIPFGPAAHPEDNPV